jgi:hypothetical protein
MNRVGFSIQLIKAPVGILASPVRLRRGFKATGLILKAIPGWIIGAQAPQSEFIIGKITSL